MPHPSREFVRAEFLGTEPLQFEEGLTVKRNRYIYPLMVLLVCGLAAGLVYAGNVTGTDCFTRNVNADQKYAAMKDLGARLRAVKDRLSDNRVIAEVNGVPVYASDFTLKKVILENRCQAGGKPLPKDSEVFTALVRETLLAEEAKRLGVLPTDLDVEKYVAAMRREFALSGDPKLLDSFLNAAGLTEEAYWSSLAPRLYRQDIIVANITKAVMEQNPRRDGESNEEYRRRIYRLNEQRMQELMNSARINILDKDIRSLL